MNQRKARRILKKMPVNFGEKGTDVMGYTNNISKSGIFIESSCIFPKNREMTVILIGEDDAYMIKGEVRWVRDSLNNEAENNTGMGIKITEAPSEYINFVEYSKYHE